MTRGADGKSLRLRPVAAVESSTAEVISSGEALSCS